MIKLIFIGAPGSGKGTMATKFVKEDNFVQLSTGEIFREISKDNSQLAQNIHKLMLKGEYIDDDLTNQLITIKINQCLKEQKSFILDGYPRNLNQARYLDKMLDVTLVVNFEIKDEQILVDRILNRLVCPKCKRGYNALFDPLKNKNVCVIDQTPLQRRNDDTNELIKKRIEIYNSLTVPLIAHYEQLRKVFNINAELNIDENYVKLKEHLGISKSNDHN